MATDHSHTGRTRSSVFTCTKSAARLRSGATLLLAAALAACGSSKASNSDDEPRSTGKGGGGASGTAGGSNGGAAGAPSGGTAGHSGGGTAGSAIPKDGSTTVGSGGSGDQGTGTPNDSGANATQSGGGVQNDGGATNPQSGTGGADIPEDCVILIRPDAGRFDAGQSDPDADLDGESYDPDASPFGGGAGGARAEAGAEASAEASAPVVLDRKGWKVVEVSSFYNNGEVDKPEYAIDGDPTTRWATGLAQADDPDPKKRQRILIDMGARQNICRITIDSRGPDSRSDQAKELDVYISDSDHPTDVTLHAAGAPITEIQFDKVQRGRYLGVVNRGSDPSLWWSIWELRAYR